MPAYHIPIHEKSVSGFVGHIREHTTFAKDHVVPKGILCNHINASRKAEFLHCSPGHKRAAEADKIGLNDTRRRGEIVAKDIVRRPSSSNPAGAKPHFVPTAQDATDGIG